MYESNTCVDRLAKDRENGKWITCQTTFANAAPSIGIEMTTFVGHSRLCHSTEKKASNFIVFPIYLISFGIVTKQKRTNQIYFRLSINPENYIAENFPGPQPTKQKNT